MNKLSPSLVKIASATGLILGAFALSALATDWTAAPCAAPGCNTSAPINVGAPAQFKLGPLAIGKSSNPAAGYDLEVLGQSYFGAKLHINGAVEALSANVTNLTKTGSLETKSLKVTGPNADQVNYVLANSNTTGDAQWTKLSDIGSVATAGSIIASGFESEYLSSDNSANNRFCQVTFDPRNINPCVGSNAGYTDTRYNDGSIAQRGTFTCPADTTKVLTGAISNGYQTSADNDASSESFIMASVGGKFIPGGKVYSGLMHLPLHWGAFSCIKR